MTFTLNKVVPWGRSFDEYVSMFSLTDRDLKKYILGCGDGPASFNATLTRSGGNVVSIDPIYRFSADEIKGKIEATYDLVIEQTSKNRDKFVWESIKTVENLGCVRMKAMNQFLADFSNSEGRYVTAELPALPFEDNAFNISLCSHLLFLYSEQLSSEFHVRSIKELCRIASEVRIFPLLELGGRESRHFGKVIDQLNADGYQCEVEKVTYEFQKGGDKMLRVKSTSCRFSLA